MRLTQQRNMEEHNKNVHIVQTAFNSGQYSKIERSGLKSSATECTKTRMYNKLMLTSMHKYKITELLLWT